MVVGMFMNGKNGYFIRCTFMNALNVDYSPDFFISVPLKIEILRPKMLLLFSVDSQPVFLIAKRTAVSEATKLWRAFFELSFLEKQCEIECSEYSKTEEAIFEFLQFVRLFLF